MTQDFTLGDISVAKAVKMLKAATGSLNRAVSALEHAARAGTLILTCDNSVVEIAFGPVREKRNPQPGKSGVLELIGTGILPLAFQLFEQETSQSRLLVDWDRSLASISTRIEILHTKKNGYSRIIPGERIIFYGVKTFVSQVNSILADFKPDFEIRSRAVQRPVEQKWARISDLMILADAGRLGDEFGHPEAHGFHALIKGEIRRRYPESDRKDWPSGATVGRKASNLKKRNAAALLKITGGEVIQTDA